MHLLRLLRRSTLSARLLRTGLLVVAGLVVLKLATVLIGHSSSDTPQSWEPPTETGPAVLGTDPPDPVLPPGFPSLESPPPLPPTSGGTQRIPTKYGLTYSLPTSSGWIPSSTAVLGWTGSEHRIVTYGSVSTYGDGYCGDSEGSSLGIVGTRGRNGISLEDAARTDVYKMIDVFTDDDGATKKPAVQIEKPVTMEISGRPAVRYRVSMSELPKESKCDPASTRIDVIATPAYASSEVAVLMIEHHIGQQGALGEAAIEAIIESIEPTKE